MHALFNLETHIYLETLLFKSRDHLRQLHLHGIVYNVPCAIRAVCRVPCAVCRVPCAVCRVQCALCRVPCAECHVPCAACRAVLCRAVWCVPCAVCRAVYITLTKHKHIHVFSD